MTVTGLQKSDLLHAVVNLPLTRDYFYAALTKTDLTPNPERALDRLGGRQNFQANLDPTATPAPLQPYPEP